MFPVNIISKSKSSYANSYSILYISLLVYTLWSEMFSLPRCDANHRSKRFVIFPTGGSFKFYPGIAKSNICIAELIIGDSKKAYILLSSNTETMFPVNIISKSKSSYANSYSILYISLLVYTLWSEMFSLSRCDANHRSKRFVIFPTGGSFKLVIGLGIPVPLGSKQSMAIGWNLQMQYSLPANITELKTYPPLYGRSKRDSLEGDRALIYRGIEEILNSEGYNGRQCLLHSICENAMSSIAHEENGLYGKLSHILFTPTYGDGDIGPDLDDSYLEAQQAGEYGVECDSLYVECNMKDGLLGAFSVFESEIY